MTGFFVVVDGPDGAGKTTLVEALVQRLGAKGVDVLQVRQPGGTPLAEAARAAALDPAMEATALAELFLMLAARADQIEKVIRPALDRGQVVVSDRYDLSTEAYQIVGRGLPRDKVLGANELATEGLRPDLMMVLDVGPEVGRRRQAERGAGQDRIEREGDEWHQRVADVFRLAAGPGIVHLDGDRSREEVHQEAWGLLADRLSETFDVKAG